MAKALDWNMGGFTPKNAGLIPPRDRTAKQKQIHGEFLESVPTVTEAFGSAGFNADRKRIWQLVAIAVGMGLIPAQYVRNGMLKNISQIIGSCVGFGAGNMLLWGSLIDALIRNQPERILVPFVPYHYGRGRLHSGIRGKGSGSMGSGQAKALKEDGFLAYDMANVPQPTFGDSIQWTSKIETDWSDGAKIPEEFIAEGRKHLVPTVAKVTSTDEAAQLADNFYVFTIASTWGGLMKCPVTEGVLLNRKSGTWNHQMSVLDYIDHPTLGRLWYVLNQWRYPHGKDPGGEWDGNTGAPEGGFYIKDADLAWIIGKQETFAFADPQGFEDRSRALDWLMG